MILTQPLPNAGSHVVVGDDGIRRSRQWQAHLLADEVLVTLVVRMHRNGRVAEHRFRTRRCHDQVTAAVCERIAQVPEEASLGFGRHFEIREGGVQHRIPVHESLAAVDQAIFVQAHEHFEHRLGQTRDPW